MKLLVIVNLDGHLYGIEGERIERIVPLVNIRPIPRLPQFVRGVMNLENEIVPVLDLCSLILDRPAKPVLSTRIMIIRYPCWDGRDRVIGLVSENITEIRRFDPAKLESPTVRNEGAPYLGLMLKDPVGLIQVIEYPRLLPQVLQQALFEDSEGGE